MSNHKARPLESGSARPRLAAVKWSIPSTEPDTSEVDESWFEERPRHSYIALKGSTEAVQVAYDVWDSPRALLVLVELPGVEAKQVSLTLGSQALYLEVTIPEGDEQRCGIPTGQYEVRVEAPPGSGPDSIDASLRHGLLRIRIAKDGAGSRRVAIVSNDNEGA